MRHGKTSFNFDSFILPKIKGGRNTAKLSYAYITPIVSLVLTYLAEKFSIISNGYIVDPSFTPFFAQAYLSSMDWRNVIFYLFLVVVSMVIYYPFFKIYEKGREMNQATA